MKKILMALAAALTVSCGEHTFEDALTALNKLDSSSSEDSKSKIPSSSSRGEQVVYNVKVSSEYFHVYKEEFLDINDMTPISQISQNEEFYFDYWLVVREFGPFNFRHGTALVDNNDNIVYAWGNRCSTHNIPEGSFQHTRIGFGVLFVPETVNPGQYRLMAAIKPDCAERSIDSIPIGEWLLVTSSAVNGPVSAPLTVTREASAATGGGYGLRINLTASKTTVNHNEEFTVTYTWMNISSNEIFPGGQAGVALVDNSGSIVKIIDTMNIDPINPNWSGSTQAEINARKATRICSVPNTVALGQYRLMIAIRPTGGEWRPATLLRKITYSIGNQPSIDFTVR
jgi:hypothetical protein